MFDILAKIQLRIEAMEQSIFQNIPNNDKISEIQSLKKIIINFKSVLIPLYEIFDEYDHDAVSKSEETELQIIESILRKIKKLIENLDNFHDITKLLRETNETLIARSTNETVKRLTLFNALLLGPSLIAAFFGMNIHFGWFTENASNGEI
jgi:Mg2+ and Co2+ transporter CorA